ncbi:MAG: RHS repeat protein, partial [Hymenobacter sp.]
MAYDVVARRTVVTNSLGFATTYVGNENGLVVEMQDARGGVTLTQYSEYNEVLSETDALGFVTVHTYDEEGSCLITTLPSGAKLRREYDEQNRLVALTDVVNGKWQWTYDAVGNLTARTNPLGNTERYEYKNGLLVRQLETARQILELAYDEDGNLLTAQTNNGQQSRWLYDQWGRVRKATDARGNVQWRAYDLLGRVLTLHEPDGNVRRFLYDALNNVVRAQDRNHDVQYSYRGLGRLIRRVEAGTAIEFLHDTEEQLRAIVNEHGLTYRFDLDGEGDVITEAGFDGLTRRYQRDASGRVLAVLLPTNERTQYTYDNDGRITEVVYGNGGRERYSYRADGMMLEASTDTSTVHFTRDVLGNILQEAQGIHTVKSLYDPLGYRFNVSSSLGAEVDYQRTEQGDIERIKTGNWQALLERDAQGLELHRTLSNNVRTRWKRDALGRPIEQRISTGLGGKERTRAYQWQKDDRLTQLQDSLYGRATFEHDTVGNLIATSFDDGTRELRVSDAVGNLFTSTGRRDRRYGLAGELLESKGT